MGTLRGDRDAFPGAPGAAVPFPVPVGLFLATLALLVLLAALAPVWDPDIFYHLATGRLILEKGLPHVNTFSFTFPDYPWHPTEWLFDTALYSVYRLFGLTGTIWFNAVLVLIAVSLAADTTRRLAGGLSWLHLPAFALVLHFSRFRFTSRPQLVTFVGLALLANLWARRDPASGRAPRSWLLVPVAAVLWANCHAGFMFGVALVLALAAGGVLDAEGGAPSRIRAARRGAIFAGAFIPFTLVNPNFAYPWKFAFFHLSLPPALNVREFAATALANHETFYLYAALFVAGLAFLPRDQRFQGAFAGFGFLALSVKTVRLVSKFGVVALPFLCQALTRFHERMTGRWRPLRWAPAAVMVGFLIPYGYRDLASLPPGLGIMRDYFPVRAVEFIRQAAPEGNLYNDNEDGGYLMFALYPWKRVFQDGRVPHYPLEFFNEIAAAMSPQAWDALMDRFQVNAALVSRRMWEDNVVDYSPLFPAPRWAMIYLDGTSYVFVRNLPANRALIERYGFRVLRPEIPLDELAAAAPRDPAGLRRDLDRLDPDHLYTGDDLSAVAYGYFLLGDAPRAKAILTRARERHPSRLDLAYSLALVEARSGNAATARDILQGIVRSPGDPEIKRQAEQALGALGRPGKQ